MFSPERKRKKKKKTTTRPESFQITSLPDDLMLSCLARISRWYYPSLSLVCKRFKSLIASPELYKTRSLLQRTESCLYVCLHFPPDLYPHWFTLRHKPNQTLTSKNIKQSSGNVLVPIPSLRSPLEKYSCLVAHGSNIYSIAEPIKLKASSSVSILDCGDNTWRKAPSLMVKRLRPCASVIDGKIYVGGSHCKRGDFETLNSIEVFDTKTETWDQVSCPNWELHEPRSVYRSACVEGKFHLMIEDKGLTYDPNEGRWDLVEAEMVAKKLSGTYCTIDNVLYSYYKRGFNWYDTKTRLWKKLKGLVGLPNFYPFNQVKMSDYGGKMVISWIEKLLPSGGRKTKGKMIWCAEIKLERVDGDEIFGKVERFDCVLTISKSLVCVKVLSATL